MKIALKTKIFAWSLGKEVIFTKGNLEKRSRSFPAASMELKTKDVSMYLP
jgi:hypothetical protein